MAYCRCETCKGRKTILAIGNMTRKCPTCKGVGHVAVVEPVAELVEQPLATEIVSRETLPTVTHDSVAAHDTPVRVKKKPGRKSKVKSNFDIVLNASQ